MAKQTLNHARVAVRRWRSARHALDAYAIGPRPAIREEADAGYLQLDDELHAAAADLAAVPLPERVWAWATTRQDATPHTDREASGGTEASEIDPGDWTTWVPGWTPPEDGADREAGQ
jgi:hypothetical protein